MPFKTMATSPGNSTSGAASRCTVRHLVDAVCKIRRQKQCATTARIHKAVRQQLQRNVEVEEVLEQLNVATRTGELWRVDNNGVTSYREPPKGTSKEHLKWSADKHAKWPLKDQQGGQFMMGHVKYPQNEHLNQPVNDHLAQRAHEHLPWPMSEQLRSSTAEPLRDHVMEPSRCSMNEPFMWPMTESMRWPAMNDPMAWPATEPLRQASVETVPQQRSETASWPMNEPFRRPVNDPLAWQMNQSLRGQMTDQFAWHVTEPPRHPMVDPLAWSVPEPLRRPMAEQLSWPGNDQLRRSIPDTLGWPVATPESFRRPTAVEHFNWCSPDSVRQAAKDTYPKPVKDTSLLSRNSGDASTVWPARDVTQASHNSAKALSRSITDSQKDSYKETSASTFTCPASQTVNGTGVLPQHKSRSISSSTADANNKFPSLPIPGPCKDLNNSCAELQRTCKQMPNVHKDMRIRDGMSQFGATQNHAGPSSHSTEVAVLPSNQGFCLPQDGQYGCLSNCSRNPDDALGPRRPQLLHGNEIAPQISTINPVDKEQLGYVVGPPYAGKPSVSGKREEERKAFQLDKCLGSLDLLPISSSATSQMNDEVLQVARSLFEDSKTEKLVAEQDRLTVESNSSMAFCSIQSATVPSTFVSSVDLSGDTLLSQRTTVLTKSPDTQLVPDGQMPFCNAAYKVESSEIKLPLSEEVDLGSCISGSFSNLAAKASEQCASIQSQTASLDCFDNCRSSVNCIVKSVDDDQKPLSVDLLSIKESIITDCKVPDHLETAVKSQSEAKSQVVKCPRMLRSKRKLGNIKSERIHLNCSSFIQLASAVQSAIKKMHGSGETATPHRVKSLILSKYKISFGSIWLLSRRIQWCCIGAVRSRWLKTKKRLHIQTSANTDGCCTPQNSVPDYESKFHEETPEVHNANVSLGDGSCGDSAEGNSSSKDLSSCEPCSRTEEKPPLEMCQSVERSACHLEEARCQPDSWLSDRCVDQEVEMPAEPSIARGTISPLNRKSVTNETPVGSIQDQLNEVDIMSGGDVVPTIDNQADANPNGLIDGLTRFFTPSNKRNSRVSRNTLQRTLEQLAKNRMSSKKKHLLPPATQSHQKLHQRQTECFTSTPISSPSSGVFKLENKKPIHRKSPSGRRREQLEDGLSHFFAVEGKRRSCTLGRLLGAERCTYSSTGKFNLPENEKSFLCGRSVRSRTRSLSLSEPRYTKALSSKKHQTSRADGREPDLSQQNISRRGLPFCGNRRSRTLSASTRSSQVSTSTVDYDKSPLSCDCKSSEGMVPYSAAPNEPSSGNLSISQRLSDVHDVNAVHFKSNFVPSVVTKTTSHVSDQEKPSSCKSSSNVRDASRLSSLSFYSKSSSSSLCTSTASAGKSAMIELKCLSSEDCSVLTGPCGSVPFETSDRFSFEDHLPANVKSEVSHATDVTCDGDAAALEIEEDLTAEQPTTIDMAEAHRIVPPPMTPNDMILFRKAQKIAAERILVTHELNNLDPCQPSPPRIQFGRYELTTAHSSRYPSEFARLPKLFICEFCLQYLKSQCDMQQHLLKCRQTCPPGNELYRADNLSVFEVSGDVSPIYCQNICLLARLFVGSKSPIQFNMSPFLFYILTLNGHEGSQLVGYFAKEKYGSSNVSIVNLLVLPQHQKKGYGDFLIQFSYLICRLNKNPGSPLKPLSLGSYKVFQSNWCKSIAECLKTYMKPEQQLAIKDISLLTGIHPNDVSATLSSLRLIDRTKIDFNAVLSVSDKALDELVSKWVLPFVDKRIRIDIQLLHWTKSSVQHILKTPFDSEKLSKAVTRKSARKIQQIRKEYEVDSISDIQTGVTECENHGEFEAPGSLLRTTKRKMTSSLDVSPSKNIRLSSPESNNVTHGGSSEMFLYGDKFEASEEERNLAWSVKSDTESEVKTAFHSVKSAVEAFNQDLNGGHSSLSADGTDPEFRTVVSTDSLAETHQMNSSSRKIDHRSHVDGVADSVTLLQDEHILEVTNAESRNVTGKKSVRSVEVQTDAYQSESSDDDSDASSSSLSESCSHCSTSDESDVDEAEEKPQSSPFPACDASGATKKADDAKDSSTENDENRFENSAFAKDVKISSPGSSREIDSEAAAAADDRVVEGSLWSAACEAVNQGVATDLLTPESLDKVPEEPTPPSDKSGSGVPHKTKDLTETEEESSSQLFDFQDLSKESNSSNSSQFDADHQHKTGDEGAFQNNFSKMPTSAGNETLHESIAPQHREVLDSHHEHDLYSETRAACNNFQFSSTHPGSAPNLAIESPLSMNSSSELGSCNLERTPSQAYSDCAQVHNAYGTENISASPTYGFVNNQNLTQITSPSSKSQITSPVSNHSFNITRHSPGNGTSYNGTSDTSTGHQVNVNDRHLATGTTFKIPVEDNRFASASSAYPLNGFSASMASPASLGQCSYMGQYADQSPGGQCNVISQNSPNGLGYNMPTPSPTNSSSRSFSMASPNTNAYHGQPTGPHAYDRSCPSAPVLSYARVLPQQLASATDNVPWTHIYPPQAAGYSLIKFPDQELVQQHAMALPRNLLPSQPTVAVQQHLTQVNLVPLSSKPAKCPTTPAPITSKQHRRCGKSCKSSTSSGLSAVRSQTVAPNVTIQPGTNMITSYNVINMNVDYRAQHPPIAAYPSSPYISNAAFINDAQQMQSLNIYQHRAISFPRQPQPHNNVYTAAYSYFNGAIAQQSFNINVNGIMRQ